MVSVVFGIRSCAWSFLLCYPWRNHTQYWDSSTWRVKSEACGTGVSEQHRATSTNNCPQRPLGRHGACGATPAMSAATSRSERCKGCRWLHHGNCIIFTWKIPAHAVVPWMKQKLPPYSTAGANKAGKYRQGRSDWETMRDLFLAKKHYPQDLQSQISLPQDHRAHKCLLRGSWRTWRWPERQQRQLSLNSCTLYYCTVLYSANTLDQSNSTWQWSREKHEKTIVAFWLQRCAKCLRLTSFPWCSFSWIPCM